MKDRKITRAEMLELIREEVEAETAKGCIFEIHPHWVMYGGDFMRDVFVAPDVVRFLLDEIDGKHSPEDYI
jgi:hypothetical protein